MRRIEGQTLGKYGEGVWFETSGAGNFGLRMVSATCEIKPVIFPPFDLLNRSFPAQVAPIGLAKRTSAKMRHVPFPALCFHKACVSGLLKAEFGFSRRGEDGVLRMQFVGAEEVMGSSQSHGVFVFGPSFRSQKIVVAVALVKVGSFGEPDGTSLEDQLGFAGQLLGFRVILLKNDSVKGVPVRSVIPNHIKPIFLAILIMKEGWVETRGVDENGVGPRAFDG